MREQEDKRISSIERGQFNCYMVADNLDRHFSWSKGNPLYNILKSGELDSIPGKKNVIIEILRIAKSTIDAHNFPELQEVTDLVTYPLHQPHIAVIKNALHLCCYGRR